MALESSTGPSNCNSRVLTSKSCITWWPTSSTKRWEFRENLRKSHMDLYNQEKKTRVMNSRTNMIQQGMADTPPPLGISGTSSAWRRSWFGTSKTPLAWDLMQKRTRDSHPVIHPGPGAHHEKQLLKNYCRDCLIMSHLFTIFTSHWSMEECAPLSCPW